MPNSRLSVEEAEQPAKVWQVNQIKEAIDSLKETVEERMDDVPTRAEMNREFEKRDNVNADIRKQWGRVIGLLWTAITTAVTTATGVIVMYFMGKGDV